MTRFVDFAPFSPPSTNLVAQLRYWAEAQPEQTAFYYLPTGEGEELRITYAELDRQARAIAARLQDMNLAGQRALLLYPPGLDFVSGFFGCLYAGVVAVPAYPPRRNRNMLRIQAISDDAEAAVAITDYETIERLETFADEAPRLKSLAWLATDKVEASLADAWQPRDISGSDLAALQYTSGSTGMPKGVMLSHENFLSNVALIAEAFRAGPQGLGVTWLPTYHDMGLVGGILNPVFIGRPTVIMPPMAFLASPVRWLRAIERFKANISGGPNFAYELCIERITADECRGLDLSGWEVAFNGAEPIRPDTLDRFTEKFAPYGFRAETHYPCYGLAEATLLVTGGKRSKPPVVMSFEAKPLDQRRAVVANQNKADRQRRLVSCGQLLADTRVVVVDPDTLQALPENHVGEVWISGPGVAQGYWNKPEATQETFGAHIKSDAGGTHLRTGDLGFLHAGELFITGRLKDMIIVRGVNRYPQDLEQTVEQADPRMVTSAAAAFAVEVQGRECLVVVAEVQRRREGNWDDAIAAIRRNLVREHDVSPDAIVLVRMGSVPKTSSGKIQRHACREAFLEGNLQPVAQWRAWKEGQEVADWSTWQDAFDNSLLAEGIDPRTARIVLEQVRAIAQERATELTLDSNIVEIGLDSLERMEIVAALEGVFGGRFPSDLMTEVETCREVILAVQAYLGPARADASSAARTATAAAAAEEGDLKQLPELQRLAEQRTRWARMGVTNPYFPVHQGIAADTTNIDGRELINFASYNYLGMSGDPYVAAASKEAIDRYGTSVSASRLVSGERPLHRELERSIATFLGVDDAITFVGGYGTNETTIGHLFGPGDLVLHDSLAHNSIVQGALLSGARRRTFPHNDWQSLDRLLGQIRHEYRRVLIAIEGAYSMDGDFPDLPKFVEVKERHRAFLMVDEAHSLGALGRNGRGIAEHYRLDPTRVEIWMGTLSKSLGSCGGYIAGCRELIEYLKYTAPGFVFSVGISPSNTAAALASLELMGREPQRVETLRKNANLFLKLAREQGLNTGHSFGTPIVPVITGDSLLALQLAKMLRDRGVNVQPIVHPAVENNAARLRFFITSSHTDQQIRYTVEVTADCWDELRTQLPTAAVASAAYLASSPALFQPQER